MRRAGDGIFMKEGWRSMRTDGARSESERSERKLCQRDYEREAEGGPRFCRDRSAEILRFDSVCGATDGCETTPAKIAAAV